MARAKQSEEIMKIAQSSFDEGHFHRALAAAYEAGRQSLAEQLQKELVNLQVANHHTMDYKVGHRDARHAAVEKVLQLVG